MRVHRQRGPAEAYPRCDCGWNIEQRHLCREYGALGSISLSPSVDIETHECQRCSFCDATIASHVMSAANFDGIGRSELVECQSCHTVRTAPWLSDAQIGELYSRDYYGTAKGKYSGIAESAARLSNRHRAALLDKQARYWSTIAPACRPRVLDIGCGRGLMLRYLHARGWESMGLERPEYPWEPAQEFTLLRSDIQAIPSTIGQFDLVTLWHSLEHMRDPMQSLVVASRLLKEGGLIAIAGPNFDSFQRMWFGPDWYALDVPRHRYHMTVQGLQSALAPAFEPVWSTSWSIWQNPVAFVQSVLNVIFAESPNALFADLRAGKRALKSRVRRLVHLLIGVILLPAALVENAASGFLGRGATFVLILRRGGEKLV